MFLFFINEISFIFTAIKVMSLDGNGYKID